jgi:hypothetical protein
MTLRLEILWWQNKIEFANKILHNNPNSNKVIPVSFVITLGETSDDANNSKNY